MSSIFVTYQGEGEFPVPGYPAPFPAGEDVEITDAFARDYFHTTAATLGARLERYNANRAAPLLVIRKTTAHKAAKTADASPDTTAAAPPKE